LISSPEPGWAVALVVIASDDLPVDRIRNRLVSAAYGVLVSSATSKDAQVLRTSAE
jgi:hypothetical protein